MPLQGVYKFGISGKSGNSTDFVRAVRKYRKSAEIPHKGSEFFHLFVIFVAIRAKNKVLNFSV